MKIKYETLERPKISLNRLRIGTCFIYERELCMYIGEYSSLDYNAVCLSSGHLCKVHSYLEVEVVECELLVRREVF